MDSPRSRQMPQAHPTGLVAAPLAPGNPLPTTRCMNFFRLFQEALFNGLVAEKSGVTKGLLATALTPIFVIRLLRPNR